MFIRPLSISNPSKSPLTITPQSPYHCLSLVDPHFSIDCRWSQPPCSLSFLLSSWIPLNFPTRSSKTGVRTLPTSRVPSRSQRHCHTCAREDGHTSQIMSHLAPSSTVNQCLDRWPSHDPVHQETAMRGKREPTSPSLPPICSFIQLLHVLVPD